MANLPAPAERERQARQQVASSNAYALASSAASQDEISRSLTDADRQALPVAAYAVQCQLRPPGGAELEQVIIELGRQIGLLRPNLAVEQKEEWIMLMADELKGLPAALVLDALPDVRRGCKFEGEVLPTLLEMIEPKRSRLEAEARHLAMIEEATK